MGRHIVVLALAWWPSGQAALAWAADGQLRRLEGRLTTSFRAFMLRHLDAWRP